LFFIGQDPPQQFPQQSAAPFSPLAFIGHEPLLQQQSALSQHEAVELFSAVACAPLFFIGQLSLFAQHEAAAVAPELFVLLKAKIAAANATTKIAVNAIKNLLFIFLFPRNLKIKPSVLPISN
jgi:hypothetical protein